MTAMFEAHPKATKFQSAIEKLETFVGELRSPKHRIWATNNCQSLISEILWASPHPSVSLSQHILEVRKLLERIARSKRMENALVDRIHGLLKKARQVAHFPPRSYD